MLFFANIYGTASDHHHHHTISNGWPKYIHFIINNLLGLFEEGEESIPEGARREIQAIVKAEADQQRQLQQQKQQSEQQEDSQNQQQQQQQRQKSSAGSMWSSFRRNQ